MAIKINNINVIDNDRNFSAAGIVTVGTGNSATTINGTTGITNVGIGITFNGIAGNISIAGTISASGFNIPVNIVSFRPVNGATNVSISTSIQITFDQVIGIGTTGYVYLRSVSAGGTTIQTIGVGDSGLVVDGNARSITIVPKSPLIPFNTSIVPVIEQGVIQSTAGSFVGLNTTGANSYSFNTGGLILGNPFSGGYLICQSGGTRWIAAPFSAEVSRGWGSINDANTTAQQVSGCTGWFVPTCGQLQNPGYSCRTYWDYYSSAIYYSSTEYGFCTAWYVNFGTGTTGHLFKPYSRCVRSFRCVAY